MTQQVAQVNLETKSNTAFIQLTRLYSKDSTARVSGCTTSVKKTTKQRVFVNAAEVTSFRPRSVKGLEGHRTSIYEAGRKNPINVAESVEQVVAALKNAGVKI